jgi:hypothetical protein
VAKYDPLGKHLRRKNPADVLMSFDDIERVIGAMLPKSAELAAWWGNEKSRDTRHVQCRAWLDAGYEATLMPGGDKVRFSRTGSRERPGP